MSLNRKVVSSTAWVGGAQVVRQLVQFASAILLTRLLLPSDFGLVAMVHVFSGFAGIIVDLGFGAAIVQKKEISELELSSAFWVNAVIGIAMMTALILVAPLLALAFSEPRLIPIARVISVTFLVGALSIVHVSMLTRSFRFQHIAIIETLALLAGVLAAVVAAFQGMGAWSLVIQALTLAFIRALSVSWVSGWKPKMQFSWVATKELMPFSLNLTGSKMINYWVRNADNLLIGIFFGTSQLGIYSRAYSLMLAPVTKLSGVISRVMFPALSTIQDDIFRIKQIYLKVLRVLALITFPASLGLIAVADTFVLGLLGPKWTAVIPILRVLCILSTAQSLATTFSIIYQATGRTDLQFKWTSYAAPIILLSFIIGLNWGPSGVAKAYVVASLIFLVYPGVRVVGSLIDMSFGEYVQNVASVFGCALAMCVVVYSVGCLLPKQAYPVYCLIFQVVTGAGLYSALVIGLKIQAFEELRTTVFQHFRSKGKDKSMVGST